MINWLQGRTQYQIAYAFSRCASAASPTIGDVRALNKIVRTIRNMLATSNFLKLKGPLRLVGYPDASFENNPDKSSQRGQAIFLAEPLGRTTDPRGSLIDFESHKINRVTLSTTVAELYACMKCFGTCQFLKGLWMDLSGSVAEVHIRTDANNLVTTAAATHLPEQRETIHMIQMLRQEANSGGIDDLGHVRAHDCLAGCLTKATKPDALRSAVNTGQLPNADTNPPFRTQLKHKAFAAAAWLDVMDDCTR